MMVQNDFVGVLFVVLTPKIELPPHEIEYMRGDSYEWLKLIGQLR
jgi:hypothetical protein